MSGLNGGATLLDKPHVALSVMPAAVPVPRPKVPEPHSGLVALHALVRDHDLWNCDLFKACRQGLLSRAELSWFFGQYEHYSRNFTRGLAACMANFPDDYWRARLSENLWEEGGGADPEERHAELFRRFLAHMGVDRTKTELCAEARLFVREWYEACAQSDSLAAVAHLSLGTEGIVSRMYEVFRNGLTRAGIDSKELKFFHLHIGCDDEHAETLEHMMMSLIDGPGGIERAYRATREALDSRLRFFDGMYERIRWRRLEAKMNAIQAKKSLVGSTPSPARHHVPAGQKNIVAYSNQNERLKIDFTVEHLSFSSEVLDTRLVRVQPGANNERHRHAHETIYYILEGTGVVSINDTNMDVKAGDVVFIPRWAFHQALNMGESELAILTVTDYSLTGKAYFGNYLKTARHDENLADVATGSMQRGVEHDAEALEASLALILERRPDFATEFYSKLFEAHPEVQSLFGRHSSAQQQRMLTESVVALVDHVNDAPWITQALRALGKRHQGYGISAEMFEWVGDALIETFGDISAEEWSEKLAVGWRSLYDEVAEIMLEAYDTSAGDA